MSGDGPVYLVRDAGQEALLQARVRLARFTVEAAEKPFTSGGVEYPRGSWVVPAQAGLRAHMEKALTRHGLLGRGGDLIYLAPPLVVTREELDRIASHVAQAREMIGKGGPIGRRLDFLAQEFNREVNTCCSKSNDLELTNTGLEMKYVVEQFREQVQNLE